MNREHARRLRQLIERISVNLTDEEALEGVELFPAWKDFETYAVGDRVQYENTLYKCLTAHDAQPTWTPSASPSLWVRVDDPSIEFPEWIQPLGATDAYPKGAKVSHNGKHWISIIDGNVWEPSVFGWDEV